MDKVAGLILAGGRSRRMGGDKALRFLKNKPLIAHVIKRLHGQAAPIALNASGDPSRFSAFGLPVIADATPDFAGPLAGVLAGMRWAARAAPDARFLVTAACDTPFFPLNLVETLLASTKGVYPRVALSGSGGKVHPVFGLWPVSLADDLASSLEAGMRKVMDWAARHPHVVAEFSFAGSGGSLADPFFNANTPDDLAEAERLLSVEQAP